MASKSGGINERNRPSRRRSGGSNAHPKEVLHLIALCEKAATGAATARRNAQELDEALRVLSTFDEGPDLILYYNLALPLQWLHQNGPIVFGSALHAEHSFSHSWTEAGLESQNLDRD
jgi:hypothetical protein